MDNEKKTENTEAAVAENDIAAENQAEVAKESTGNATIGENTAADDSQNAGEKKKKPLIVRVLSFFIPWKGDDAFDVIRKLVFIGALTAFIIVAVPFISDWLAMQKDQQVSQEIADIYIPLTDEELAQLENQNKDDMQSNGNADDKEDESYVPKVLPSFEKLHEINTDIVGFIDIDGTAISYPVVKGADNDYYLTHDIYNFVNKSGTVMMDYRNVVSGKKDQSDNFVLYGHNMAIGTYFASLSEYWRTLYDRNEGGTISYYKAHPTIRFDTMYEQAVWKIFAVGIYNTNYDHGEVYPYIDKLNFATREEFNQFAIDVMDRSDLFTDVDLQYGDDILTLSTCYWPYSGNDYIRLAVFARKVRPGESPEVDVEKAQVNTFVKRWQWVYDKIGGGYDWSQSNWDRRKLLSYTEEDAKKDGYTFLDRR